MSRDDDAHLTHIYLSKLDVSEDLICPELYNQCASLLHAKQTAIIDVDASCFVDVQGVAKARVKISGNASTDSLFDAIIDSTFERAMCFYKKQKDEMMATFLLWKTSNSLSQEQARKALEGALGGKKNEFEKWDKEIKKREEVGGGGDAGGGGGWFGWGGRFGGSNGDRFWGEAQQTSLAVLGIIVMYLIIVKGELMLAVIFNPLLFVLRGSRNGFTSIKSWIFRTQINQADFDNLPTNEGLCQRESCQKMGK